MDLQQKCQNYILYPICRLGNNVIDDCKIKEHHALIKHGALLIHNITSSMRRDIYKTLLFMNIWLWIKCR